MDSNQQLVDLFADLIGLEPDEGRQKAYWARYDKWRAAHTEEVHGLVRRQLQYLTISSEWLMAKITA